MSNITEAEIAAMTKEQNYTTGYINGTNDAVDKIRDDMRHVMFIPYQGIEMVSRKDVLDVIDKHYRNKLTEIKL